MLALCLPVIAAAGESEPVQQPAPPVSDEARPLDAATMSALGITESPATETARALRPAPESGSWSWAPGQYSYDGSGNITAIGAEASFFYDSRGRLVDATLSRGQATEHRGFVYDAFGNRTSMTGGSSTISTVTSVSTNHLTGLSAVYDAAGNVTQIQPPGQSTIYQQKFDALGSLQEVKASNVSGLPPVLHIYTADDERLWTFDLAANASHWKIRDLQGKVVRDYYVPGTNWTLSRDYIYRDGALLAAVTPTETLHFSLDHLGTPRVITGANRNRLGFHHYMPFGEEWTDESGAQEGEPMKFTGHERDPDAVTGDVGGFDYMHARYYSANVGRFLSIDPVLEADRALPEPQRWNRYSYVVNNPLRWTDPTGRCVAACVGDLVIGGVVGTVIIGGVIYGVLQNVFSDRADPYAPDRKLPTDPVTGNPVIDDGVVGPHTQLGKRTSKSTGETYVQGREFDESGNRVKDIDHTDHGRKDHDKPHEHPYDPTTGKRLPQQPLQPGVKPEPKPQPPKPTPPKPDPVAVVPVCTAKSIC